MCELIASHLTRLMRWIEGMIEDELHKRFAFWLIFFVLLPSNLVLLQITTRMVEAEDDCAYNTYMVERLPVFGLVCIGEPIQ